RGVVLDASGNPAGGARVGGGYTVVTADSSGHFVMTDVPVGHRTITAVSDALHTTGSSVVDIPYGGAVVQATIVLTAVGSIAGVVRDALGNPVPGNRVFLFETLPAVHEGDPLRINVLGQTTTDTNGAYTFDHLAVPDRTRNWAVSSFLPDF